MLLSLKKVITLLRWSMFITGLGILAIFRWSVSKQTDFSSKGKQTPSCTRYLTRGKGGAPEISPKAEIRTEVLHKIFFYMNFFHILQMLKDYDITSCLWLCHAPTRIKGAACPPPIASSLILPAIWMLSRKAREKSQFGKNARTCYNFFFGPIVQ